MGHSSTTVPPPFWASALRALPIDVEEERRINVARDEVEVRLRYRYLRTRSSWIEEERQVVWRGGASISLLPWCIGSAGNGELPLPNKTLERAWFGYPDLGLTALPGSLWLDLAVCQTPFLAGRRELAFALGKDDGLMTF